ncbi:MAG: isoprenylcysteine carboxylmethyltransferase family protein [Flavobacteriia bacterium]|nr:isoprenylcysteine carboxylmethyltransferase family protein [Flavobacteriia bacterium]
MMTYIFVIVVSSWLLTELWYAWRLRDPQPKKTDESSLLILLGCVILGVSAGAWIALYLNTAFQQSNWIQGLALVLMAVGVIGRAWVISTLGKFFTVNVRIHQEHELKTDGFYRRVRHPSYSFLLLTFVGFCIQLNHWLAALAVMIPVLLAFQRRIVVEEKVLLTHFGNAYQEYMSKTKRLIPWIS